MLSIGGKVGKSNSGKCTRWNVLDDQGYTKVIDFEKDVEKWEEL